MSIIRDILFSQNKSKAYKTFLFLFVSLFFSVNYHACSFGFYEII